jgi:hypothetical protein
LNENLLQKAVPLDEYKKRINAQGLRIQKDSSRHLEDAYNDDGNDEEEQYENEDDFYVNENNYVNFTDYSFKYAKCQPVQRFSQKAVEAGEYSPMVVNDIVVLRLCPSSYCSDSRAYGCNTEYVEYAVELTDYIRIMLRYEMDKKDQLCDWCDNCYGNRRTAQKYYYTYDEYGNVQLNYYEEEDDAYSNLDCSEYSSYCLDSYNKSVCVDDDGDDDDGSSYYFMTTEGYMDYIDCTQVNGGYFLRPRCDAYSETLTMGVYHDKFCSHYAGSEMSINSFNLGINATYFQEFGKDAGCQDCTESSQPPYFNANSNLCNRLDFDSARCTLSSSSELFSSNYTSTDKEQCSFIDSVRYGTYDADGQLYVASTVGRMRKVTNSQKWLMVLSMLVSGILAIYSCYLHHAITNLLIKSLSHTDLLPPSKYRRRASSKPRKARRGSRKLVDDDGNVLA